MDSISQHSLHDELLMRLKKMIISGQFLPGDKIPERLLCEQFGVSRTPLREALKVLAAEGLVELAPNRGAVVASLGPEEVEECLPISATIEALSGELACENITDAEIQDIKALNTRMVAEYQVGDVRAFLATNHEIHEKIVAATKNPLLADIYDTVFFRIGWARLMAELSPAKMAEMIADHMEIVKALEARQGQRLSELLRSSMEHVLEAERRQTRQ